MEHSGDPQAIAYDKDTALTYVELYKHQDVIVLCVRDSRNRF